MARVCVDDIFFEVLPDGRLTLKAENLGHATRIIYNGWGSSTDFVKADFPDYARFYVRAVGAGGGAGGAVASAGESALQGGGGGGGYADIWLTWTQLAAIETVTVGAGGAGGVGANPGANGGASSFGTWAVANGGIGGTDAMATGTIPSSSPGAAGGTASTVSGDLALQGGPGLAGIRLAALSGVAGKGGDSRLGYGGMGRTTGGNGIDGQSYGGGGGGPFAANATRTGGNGAGGVVIVDVWF